VSKGSNRRPAQVPHTAYADRWDATFRATGSNDTGLRQALADWRATDLYKETSKHWGGVAREVTDQERDTRNQASE
jgi:hypothetical protein